MHTTSMHTILKHKAARIMFALLIAAGVILVPFSVRAQDTPAARSNVKAFTLTKKPNAASATPSTTPSTPETTIGEYDTFSECFGHMDINDKTSLYTVYVNKSTTISAAEDSWQRSNNKIRLTSGKGGPYTLTRNGTKDLMLVDRGAELTIDNLTLDGNNESRCLGILDGGKATIGKGTIIQNFGSVPALDGPAIFANGGELTIEDGATIKNNRSNEQGGAIQICQKSTLTIKGGLFENNTSTKSGGAIAAYGKLRITGGTFRGNSSQKEGGAIRTGSETQGSITGATFTANKAKTGGAIYCDKEIKIATTSFRDNEAQWGGAICAAHKLSLTNTAFTQNTAKKKGGALFLYEGGTITGSSFTNNTVTENNSPQQGGAIFALPSTLSIQKSTFTKNAGAKGGGAIFIDHDVAGTKQGITTVSTSEFIENFSSFGGGIYVGINNKLQVNGSKFVKNEAGVGAGIASVGSSDSKPNLSGINVTNCLFNENKALMGAGMHTAFPTHIVKTQFIKNYSDVHPQDDQTNPHSSGCGGALYVRDQKTTIQETIFKENAAFGSGGAICISGREKNDDQSSALKPNCKVEISKNTEFRSNTVKVGQGGAIYVSPYAYEHTINDPAAYTTLTTDKTTIFVGNKSEAGLFNPPTNCQNYTNLAFSDVSDVTHETLTRASLLNNYDVNYKNSYRVIVYKAAGGTFDDAAAEKTVEHEVDSQIKILPAPQREGYTFLNWKSADNKTYNPADVYRVTKDQIFTAQWKKIPTPKPDPTPTPDPTPSSPTPGQPAQTKPIKSFTSKVKSIPKTGDPSSCAGLGLAGAVTTLAAFAAKRAKREE